MKIRSEDQVIDIEDKYISYSPFLDTIANTDVGVDVDEEGAIIIDQPASVIKEYASFLRGDEFSMDEEVASFFEFMGHSNNMEYPLDYWKIKLQDNWTRDNFYRLDLVSDPYYGLTEIPVKRSLYLGVIEPLYIAGGAAMYMAGYITEINDIDLFTTNQSMANSWINDNFRTIKESDHVITACTGRHKDKKIQLIKRVYQSPSEIVHGFDLDCVGVIWDGNSLWATRRAIWSYENKINWFDPDRMSPSYVHRLTKYMRRGFSIQLPFIDRLEINEREVSNVWRSMRNAETRNYITSKNTIEYHIGDYVPLPDPRHIGEMNTYSDIIVNENVIKKYISMMTNRAKYIFYYRITGSTVVFDVHDQQGEERVWFHPIHMENDPASMLLLAVFYGFHVDTQIDVSDYETIGNTGCYTDIRPKNKTTPWMTIDPMQQLSGTFNPEVIDFIDWIRSSPLVN